MGHVAGIVWDESGTMREYRQCGWAKTRESVVEFNCGLQLSRIDVAAFDFLHPDFLTFAIPKAWVTL